PAGRRARRWFRCCSPASSRSAESWPERSREMARRVIDLSQPLSRESQLHPFFPPTQVLRHIQHTDAAPGRPSFNAEIIITSNHAATHVDAFGHYDPAGGKIAEIPLDTFCGDAICVDIPDYPGGPDVTAAEG